MTHLDDAEKKAQEIFQEAKANLENIATEEDTKIQIINRILSDSLGWPYSSFRAETHHENGYSDYILVENQKPMLLLEAKRSGLIEVATAAKEKVRYLKISGSSLKKAKDGINQAASYSLSNGIPISVLTDGVTWLIFKTFIPGENFKTKEAIVFPSFDAVLSDFSVFYDLLSRRQFGERIYNSIFDKIHNKRLILEQTQVAPLDKSDITLSQKSDIAFDLDKIFSKFFTRLTGDDDEDLLIECFVETRESRIADFSLEKMTRNVLGNIAPYEKDVDSQLTSVIKANIEADSASSESGQTVFIVGPTGAGKSTFLERFFRKTLPGSVRRQCVLVSVNCLDATGRESTALDWVIERVISDLEHQLYKDNTPTWDDLMGLYHGEYLKRVKGVDSQLYNRDKQAFKEKFGRFLDDKVENDREGYLKRILTDIVDNRKLLPVILVDNTDEFSIDYKQRIFQFTQALRRHANHCLVIFPVTDKSAWSFSKTDIFGIYRSRSFFLPTPSPREVFRKRIDFLKQKLLGEKSNRKNRHDYFAGKGIGISIKNLDGFAQVLENIFVDHDYTSKTIGELTNYNIRRTLALSQRVITSPVIKIEDLIKSYLSGKFVTTNFSKFMEALMKGDYQAYKHSDNHEIYPIFQADNEIRQSPLLKLRILTLLDSIHRGGRSVEEKHLGVQSVISYFDAMGCSEISVEKNLMSLLEAGLVEPYDISNRDLSVSQKVAITYRGKAHLRLASHNGVFFYQMALTTAIMNQDVAEKIGSMYKSRTGFSNKVKTVKNLFLEYLLEEDNLHTSQQCEQSQYDCQKSLIVDLKGLGDHSSINDNELTAILGDEFKQGVVKKGVIATVDFFDASKGFGFAEIDETDSRIFIRVEKLKDYGVDSIKDGDSLLCDLARGPKGLYIEKIHDIQTDTSKVETADCKIIRLFPDRGYGFVKLLGSDRTAFFHVSVFPEVTRSKIFEGQLLKAEIGPDRKGEGHQIKQIVSINSDGISS